VHALSRRLPGGRPAGLLPSGYLMPGGFFPGPHPAIFFCIQ
jgi:hypothetical protein